MNNNTTQTGFIELNRLELVSVQGGTDVQGTFTATHETNGWYVRDGNGNLTAYYGDDTSGNAWLTAGDVRWDVGWASLEQVSVGNAGQVSVGAVFNLAVGIADTAIGIGVSLWDAVAGYLGAE